jgi:uncharacterized damage-inducible protein DinB
MAHELDLVRDLFAYHRWANRRLFDVAAALGPEVDRDMGTQWSVPTLKGMLAHIYAADLAWLSRWNGTSPTRLLGGDDFPTLADLRARWDTLEREQQAFIDTLTADDLGRPVDYRNTAGRAFRLPLGPLLQHVANHATHHRSEAATMLTMLRGSPPATDLLVYQLQRTGQAA